LYSSDFDFNRREIMDHTLQYFARTFGNWSVFAPPVMDLQYRVRLEPRLYDTTSNMLTFEAMQNCESGLYPPKKNYSVFNFYQALTNTTLYHWQSYGDPR
jgi:hypothetical protein